MASLPRSQALAQKLNSRKATVAVVGLGYVGLPLATAIGNAGFTIIGIDRDETKIRRVMAGDSYVDDVPDSMLGRLVSSGHLTATTSYEVAAHADVAVIAVPTPIDEFRIPDLSHVRSAAAALAEVMRPPALVVLESTTYPGTTEEVIAPAFRDRGFILGREFFLAYSPERIDPGNEKWNVQNTPKVIAGLTKECLDLAIRFYSCFVQKLVPVSNLQTAEVTKLFENIFRIVNIALVNEFQLICDAFGIDVWEVLEACKTKPYGFMPFQPGPGLGGHCVPVDPFYLAWKAREKRVNTEFIELAGRINAGMPRYVVSKVAKMLNASRRSLNSSRIALLGVAYKRNSADVRESPAIRIIELLLQEGASVSYHDPHVPVLMVNGKPLLSQPLTADYLAANDCALAITDHDKIDWTMVLQYAPMVVDTRNVLGRLMPPTVPSVLTEATRD